MAEYIDRSKLKEDSEYNPVSGEYLSYSRGQIWNAPTEKVIDISVLDNIKEDVKSWYWQADKQRLAEDPCVVDAMTDLFIRTIDKYKAESEGKE